MLSVNSPPLSLRNVLLKMYLMMMTVDAEKLVQWSTTCKRILPLQCFKSIATVSRNVFDIGRPVTGLGGGFLYILHVGNSLETSFLLSALRC